MAAELPKPAPPEGETQRLRLLLETARELGAEVNLDLLIERLIERTSRIMNCVRSSVFLLDGERDELYTLVAQGLESREIRIPLTTGLAGYVARTGEKLNVSDAYSDARFNADVDKRTGFHTHSVLALPLQDHKGSRLGVIQCLNKCSTDGQAVPFDAEDESFLSALGSLAAVFLENAKLYREQDELLEALVSAFSRAIDDRDPCTSGHTRRVTRLSLNLARAVHDSHDAPFDQITYTRERLRQLRYAALLHDIGKIGVREYILCKAERLPQGGIENLQLRLELLRERNRGQALEKMLNEGRRPEADAELRAFADGIQRAIDLTAARNQPGPVRDGDLDALNELRSRGWLTAEEFDCLCIRQGTLTPTEMADMRSHVQKSYEMLRQIPWPKALKEVPEVAYSHHEKRDGTGYPRGLTGDAIHLDGQIMAIADIYDALTASDRPYKKAVPHEKAKAILIEDAERRGALNPDLARLFFERECYRLPAEL
jgi:HD-GYP domain-containing protein (c-di-GMP phosphodiesterase class II)